MSAHKAGNKINWTNTLFLTLTPLIGIIGAVILISLGMLSGKTIILALVLTAITGFSITAGYHRLFSHLSYKAAWPVRAFFMLFGAATFEGSVLEWCTDHRNHHRYTDTPKDPYSIKGGFWHAHMGWLLTMEHNFRQFDNIDDLKADRLVQLQHDYYLPLAIGMGFLLPMAIATLWGDPWGGLFVAGALRIAFNMQLTFCINSVCHYFGKQTYTDRNTARDNWFTALFTYGEGYHNFHHRFPLDYRNGIRFYHFDPTKWIIAGLAYCGLAWDLKTVKQHRIIQAKIDHDQKRLTLAAKHSRAIVDKINQVVQPLYQSVTQSLTRVDELEKKLRELKARKGELMRTQIEEYRQHIKRYRAQLQQARSELKAQLKLWQRVVDGSLADGVAG
jgi:stearoyl-CoA desaturase (Delta-9 desaturase)